MLPSLEGSFQSKVILFDDSVLTISSYRRQFAVLVRAAEVHQTFSAMFDTIWEMSREVPSSYEPKPWGAIQLLE